MSIEEDRGGPGVDIPVQSFWPTKSCLSDKVFISKLERGSSFANKLPLFEHKTPLGFTGVNLFHPGN